jgi:hypothetical protein
MDPGQRDVRRHRAERDRVVPDTGKVLVGGPIVGDQRVWGRRRRARRLWVA